MRAQWQCTEFEWAIHEALTASDIAEGVRRGLFVARWSDSDPVAELCFFPADKAPTEDLVSNDEAIAALERRVKMFLGVIN